MMVLTEIERQVCVLHSYFLKNNVCCDLLTHFLCREWTGDLKKLPNIKLRKVSHRDLDTKNNEEDKHKAEDDNEDDEDDLDDEQLEDMTLMTDSN